MTNEEAVKHGKEQLEIFDGEHKEFIEIAIEALEKQIPKKPVYEYRKNVLKRTVCPNCEHIFGIRKEHNFCWNCGQAIDWSEEE